MRLIALAFLSGTAAGGAATYGLVVNVPSHPFEVQHSVSTTGRPASARPVSSEPDHSSRALLYRFAIHADFTELRESFAMALLEPQSKDRDFTLGTIIARMSEIDPDRTLGFLKSQAMDPVTAQQMALRWLQVVGTNQERIDAVAAALPQIDERRLLLLAAVELAGTQADDALRLALAIDARSMRADAIRSVSNVVAEIDPHRALEISGTLDDERARFAFVRAAVTVLARADAAFALDYVERLFDGTDNQKASLSRLIAEEILRADPSSALLVARQIDGWAGESIERSALERLARSNALAAFAYAEGLPPGQRRQRARESVSRIYAESDPDAALAWARSFDPLPGDIREGVIDGIARIDPLRALDLMLTPEFHVNPFRDGSSVLMVALGMRGATDHGISAAEIGDRLLEIEDVDERNRWVDRFVNVWTNRDPNGVVSWLTDNPDRVSGSAVNGVARDLADRNPAAALSLAAELPVRLRDEWVGSVAGHVARMDPSGAMAWLDEFREESFFEAAAIEVVEATLSLDPVPALTLFGELSETAQAEAARDGARRWRESDATAARNWVFSLRAGAVRDAALSGLLEGNGGRRRMRISSACSTRSLRAKRCSSALFLALPAGSQQKRAG